MWFAFRKLLENGEIILFNDERLKRQLSGRYYKPTDSGPLKLESKIVARSKGHLSPDRADATILVFSNYRSQFTDNVERLPIPARPTPPEAVMPMFTLAEHAKRQSSPDEYSKYYGDDSGSERRPNYTHLRQLIEEHNNKIRQTV